MTVDLPEGLRDPVAKARVARLHSEIQRLGRSPAAEGREARIKELKTAVALLRDRQLGFTSLRWLVSAAWPLVIGLSVMGGAGLMLRAAAWRKGEVPVGTDIVRLVAIPLLAVVVVCTWDYVKTRYRLRQAEALADALADVSDRVRAARERPAPDRTVKPPATPVATPLRPWGIAVDLIAFGLAAGGLVLTDNGLIRLGGIGFFAPLAAFPFALARRARTVLPFSFTSHFVVSVLAIVALVIATNSTKVSPAIGIGSVGFVVYHYVCIAIREKKIRYGRFAWRTADAASKPVVYWSWVGLFSLLAAAIMAGLFLAVAWRPNTDGQGA